MEKNCSKCNHLIIDEPFITNADGKSYHEFCYPTYEGEPQVSESPEYEPPKRSLIDRIFHRG